jgi:PIN domain nuclease of toxin-antitoxin system
VKLLLDTHLLLWAMISPERLSAEITVLLEDSANEIVFSVASIWEASIKYSRGRTDFKFEPRAFRRQLLESGFSELSVLGEHALTVSGLPAIHKDPFDRILIAQALVEGITLFTSDLIMTRYSGPIRLV